MWEKILFWSIFVIIVGGFLNFLLNFLKVLIVKDWTFSDAEDEIHEKYLLYAGGVVITGIIYSLIVAPLLVFFVILGIIIKFITNLKKLLKGSARTG